MDGGVYTESMNARKVDLRQLLVHTRLVEGKNMGFGRAVGKSTSATHE